jgi:nucleoside-diphosphate-sugar epimerase
MKIAVFGATGGTGKHIVKQALDAGHEVVAYVRTPSKMDTQHDNLKLVQGDVTDADCVQQAVAGTDAVISALAPSVNKPDYVISQGMEHIINAMKQHNVQRLIVTAGAGVPDPNDKPGVPDRVIRVLLHLISKHVVKDMEMVVDKVKASGLDYTIGRAPMLTNQPGTGDIKADYLGGDVSARLSREDFARFLLQQLESDQWLNKAPAVSN